MVRQVTARSVRGAAGGAARIRRLRHAMVAAAMPSLLVTHLPDVRYLTGFTGSNAVLAVTASAVVLLTDSRYATQAKEEIAAAGSRARVLIRKTVLPDACALLLARGARPIAYDAEHVTIAELARMEAVAGAGGAQRRRAYKPADPYPMPGLREIKDEDELRSMEAAALLGCRLFDAVVPHLEAGTPERDVAADLEFFARSLGADGMSFETIVASGLRSALPHGTASERPLPRRGFVTLDFGVILRGYCSDMTRTVYLGRPMREESAAYEAVLEAQEAGIAAVRAGVTGKAVDAAARRVLRRHQLARYFTHSTGHGVGMEIHEGPRLSKKGEQALAAGMVVTIEPGIYLPGRYGIRIEDMVAVTVDGGRVLTPHPKPCCGFETKEQREAETMNPEEMKELKELIEFLKENKIGEFALERGELKVQLKFQSEAPAASGSALDSAMIARLLSAQQPHPHLMAAPASAVSPLIAAETPAETAAAAAAADEASLHTVKSPIVGTFYESASPGASAFVKAGDHVDVGQPLCIIEAMKLMNEIESDVAGEVVKRLVQNGQPVEFGQPLFTVRAH